MNYVSDFMKKTRTRKIESDNERCFLGGKPEIKYHSIFLQEVFLPGDIPHLIKSLEKIYKKVENYKLERIYKCIKNLKNRDLYSRNFQHLPYILNKKYENKYLIKSVSFELNEYVDFIVPHVYIAMPSFIILKFDVILNDKATRKINEIFYSKHVDKEEGVKGPRGEHVITHFAENRKRDDIHEFRNSIKSDAIGFLSKYFNGCFFNLENAVYATPSIELFSLDSYPTELKTIKKWLSENYGFFNCINLVTYPKLVYKKDEYLFFYNEKYRKNFSNFSIIANRKNVNSDSDFEVSEEIERRISYLSFDLIAVWRWLEIQEKLISELSSISIKGYGIRSLISETIKDFVYPLMRRTNKSVSKRVFQFDLFHTEFSYIGYKQIPDIMSFSPLEGKGLFFDSAFGGIGKRIEELKNIISTLTRNQNIEYNKLTQKLLLVLTFFMTSLMILQLISTPDQFLSTFDFISKSLKNLIYSLSEFLFSFIS